MVGPTQTAAALILDDDGRVLLIRENYGHRRYGTPGGLVEPGETPEEAVIREVREETTLKVEVLYPIGVYLFPDLPEPFQAYAFRCKIVRGKPVVPPTDEIASVGWFDLTDLPSPLTYLAPHAIADLVAGKRNVSRTVNNL